MRRRAVVIGSVIAGAAFVFAVKNPSVLRGSLLDSSAIALKLKQSADTNGDAILTDAEMRISFTQILKGVRAQQQAHDVNEDGAVNRADVVAAQTAFRSLRGAACGNGLREAGETCDDGATVAGDGCSATCSLELGYACTAATPNVCRTVCGDGLIRGSETCDDGDTDAGDGCSNVCVVEDGYSCSNTPSECHNLVCINGIDDDGDGGIDVPGSAVRLTQDPGRDIDGVLPPSAIDGEWYYAPMPTMVGSMQTYTLGIWSFQSGQLAKHLPDVEGFSSGRAAYDAQNKILYQYSGPFDTRIFKVPLAGLSTSLESTYVGPASHYGFYGAKLSADTSKLYILFQSAQTNPANRDPALLQEINTATMQKSRQVSMTDLTGVDGMVTMIYDGTRAKMYLLDQLNTNVPELRVREIDLQSMTRTGRSLIIDGDPMSDVEFDEESGALYVVQNPKYWSETTLQKIDLSTFTKTTLVVHDGSSVTMDGHQYTKLSLNMLWARSSTNRLVALAHYGTSYPWSRSFFMIFDVADVPTLQETYTDLPVFSTAGNPAEYLPRAIDSVRGVVYLEPYWPSSPTPTWHIIAPERHFVVSKTTQEFLGNASYHGVPVDWEPSRPLSMDADHKNVLILPGFTLSSGYHVWPLMRVNAGDAECTSDTDASEVE